MSFLRSFGLSNLCRWTICAPVTRLMLINQPRFFNKTGAGKRTTDGRRRRADARPCFAQGASPYATRLGDLSAIALSAVEGATAEALPPSRGHFRLRSKRFGGRFGGTRRRSLEPLRRDKSQGKPEKTEARSLLRGAPGRIASDCSLAALGPSGAPRHGAIPRTFPGARKRTCNPLIRSVIKARKSLIYKEF